MKERGQRPAQRWRCTAANRLHGDKAVLNFPDPDPDPDPDP